jgi:NADH-quinone oxidoreductase subunit N
LFIIDIYSLFFLGIIILSALLVTMLSYDYIKQLQGVREEYYIILFTSTLGASLLAVADHFILFFLGIETLSISLYILIAFQRSKDSSIEAGIKYLILASVSSAFLLFGMALIYTALGTMQFNKIVSALSNVDLISPLVISGFGMMMVGIGFKLALVPFHMWTPDVYQGSPSAVTAFMSVGAKAGGFAALLRVFIVAFSVLAVDFTSILWVLAALTMFLGNLVAISQVNIKRMLAYSSIAHAGYILMAFVPYGQAEVATDAVAAALFYLLAYALTSFAAWAVVISLEKAEGRGLSISDYAGMGRKYPLLAAVMAVAMLSFTGVPPTLGFVGKFYLFRTVVEGGFIGLALIGVLTSLISAYYYLRVVVVMYMQDGEPEAQRDLWVNLTAAVAGVAVVLLSIFSVPLFNWVSQATLMGY